MPIPTKRAANELSAARPGKNLSEIKCPAPVQRTLIKNGEFVESELGSDRRNIIAVALMQQPFARRPKEKPAGVNRRARNSGQTKAVYFDPGTLFAFSLNRPAPCAAVALD
jgi:hypothetical protein